MKPILAVICIAYISTVQCVAAYDKKLVHVLEQLRQCSFALDEELPMVGGAAIGSAGTPHEFYLLTPYVSAVASEEDLRAMLRDQSAVVRIMAAQCILKQKDDVLRNLVDMLAKDTAKVFVAPFGCEILKMTVSAVISELKKDPDYLGYPKEPNQAVQRTSATPPSLT